MLIRAAILLFAFALPILAATPSSPTTSHSDAEIIARCDAGLAEVIKFMRSKPELFREQRENLLTLEEKREIWNTWKRFLDYQIALEAVAQVHSKYHLLDGKAERASFFSGYSASLTQYRYALEFLEITRDNSALDKLLDESVPDIGLDANAYSKFKFQFLNAGRGIEFAAREVVYASYARKEAPPNAAALKSHSRRVWAMGKGRGQQMTLANAGKIVRKVGFNAWLPIQTGVSEWMGDTKVYRVNSSLITEDQIAALKLSPGDIMLQRRDWYLSNIGLPGYWPHAALYIGTPEERRAFFNDPEVIAWVKKNGEPSGDFEKLLQSKFPKAYEWTSKSEDGHAYRVIEAISEGVTFTTLEHSAGADSMAALRPRRTKKEKAAAIFRAFHYAGRPYDFNFDFDTDASLVCTELVCKAYEPNPESAGLSFPVDTMLGRKVIPANLMVRHFDETYGTEKQELELVQFLDAKEKSRRAVISTLEEFRQSWRRPKWHVFMQGR
ncbi:MAG TPA: YiiX/YebB-like N1pC/P60 family cysteine hydrolase [Verrucomicrobiae bacterium]